jgi:SAM-dependent methyltransferase
MILFMMTRTYFYNPVKKQKFEVEMFQKKLSHIKCICCLESEMQSVSSKLAGLAECRSCGFIFQLPSDNYLTREKIAQHYVDRDPHKKVAAAKEEFFLKALKYVQPRIENGNRLLDIGCGYGYFLNLAKNCGWESYGVELMAEGVRATIQIVGDANVHQGTVKEADFESNLFDVITMWDVFMFMEDAYSALRECFRIMKKGALIGIRVRNAKFQKRLFQIYQPFKKVIEPMGIRDFYVFHPHNFSRLAIENLMKRVGFTNVQIHNSPLTHGDPYGYSRMSLITGSMKKLITRISSILYHASEKKFTISPSLLIWAEKPF